MGLGAHNPVFMDSELHTLEKGFSFFEGFLFIRRFEFSLTKIEFHGCDKWL